MWGEREREREREVFYPTISQVVEAEEVMGEGIRQRIHGAPLMSTREEDYDELFDSDSFSSDCDSDDDERSAEEDATSSSSSSAGSSPPSSKSSSLPPKLSSNGPLYELSSIMEQLPVKRGLSNYYHGKSQSFTSLADVNCVEDLPKKEVPFKRRMKSCKSYAGGLDGSHHHCRSSDRAPADAMPKKPPPPRVASCAALMSAGAGKPPALPARKSVFFTLN